MFPEPRRKYALVQKSKWWICFPISTSTNTRTTKFAKGMSTRHRVGTTKKVAQGRERSRREIFDECRAYYIDSRRKFRFFTPAFFYVIPFGGEANAQNPRLERKRRSVPQFQRRNSVRLGLRSAQRRVGLLEDYSTRLRERRDGTNASLAHASAWTSIGIHE